jgi:hypothetical protein
MPNYGTHNISSAEMIASKLQARPRRRVKGNNMWGAGVS